MHDQLLQQETEIKSLRKELTEIKALQEQQHPRKRQKITSGLSTEEAQGLQTLLLEDSGKADDLSSFWTEGELKNEAAKDVVEVLDDTKTEDTKTEAAKDDTKTDDTKTEDTKTEDTKTEDTKTEASKDVVVKQEDKTVDGTVKHTLIKQAHTV